MTNALSQLPPLFVGLSVGQMLRWTGVMREEDAGTLLRAFFYAVAPALAVSALSTIELTAVLALFPLIALAMAASPPLWGMALGLVVNASKWELPEALACAIDSIASTAIPLLALALGVLWKPSLRNLRIGAITYGLRLGTGLVIAITLVGLVLGVTDWLCSIGICRELST